MKTNLQKTIIVAWAITTACAGFAAPPNEEAKLHKFSTTIEKERPELNEETKKLIAAYRRNPSQTNRAALKKQLEINYDKVVERKKAKLEELKRTAKHASKVQEMQLIVDEMLQNRDARIGQEADMSILATFSRKKQPLRLKGLSFCEFFEWLSKSVTRVSESRPGEKIKLDTEGIKGWGEI